MKRYIAEVKEDVLVKIVGSADVQTWDDYKSLNVEMWIYGVQGIEKAHDLVLIGHEEMKLLKMTPEQWYEVFGPRPDIKAEVVDNKITFLLLAGANEYKFVKAVQEVIDKETR